MLAHPARMRTGIMNTACVKMMVAVRACDTHRFRADNKLQYCAENAADGDEDMFADSDDEAPAARPAAAAPAAAAAALPAAAAMHSSSHVQPDAPVLAAHPEPASAAAAPAAATTVAAADAQVAGHDAAAAHGNAVHETAASEAVDYATWPISELKRLLTEAGVDVSSYSEKQGLVDKAKEIEQSREVHSVPAGFVLDPGSGYFHNAEQDLYFDAPSGYYYRGGKWLYMQNGELAEMPAQGAAENGSAAAHV